MPPGGLITLPAQIEWNSTLLLGDGTDYLVSGLEGWWDLPALDSGNVPKAAQHGAWSGRDLMQERIVTVEFRISPESGTTETLVSELLAATSIGDDSTEYPLIVNAYGTHDLVYAKLTRRAVPMPLGYRRWINGCALQWTCSDPRKYAATEQSITILAPTPAVGGLDWPLEYPLDWGTPGTPGVGTATNSGSTPVLPRLVFTGPVTRPQALNFATNSRLEFDLELGAGEQLVVDCAAGTALKGGGSFISTLTPESVPLALWTLAPGPNPLVFRGESFAGEGGTLQVFWRSGVV